MSFSFNVAGSKYFLYVGFVYFGASEQLTLRYSTVRDVQGPSERQEWNWFMAEVMEPSMFIQ
jgi:hypothetical protein